MIAAIVRRPSLRALAGLFGWYGNSTFGGGTATIVELERRLVDQCEWLTRSDSRFAYAISRLTPGTNLLAYCAAAGARIRGLAGALVAVIAASVPCSLIAIALTRFFATWAKHPLSALALKGALAAAIAIMGGTVWTMLRPDLAQAGRLRTLLLAAGAFCVADFFQITPIQVLVAAAVLGAVWTQADTPV
jgi:chromate transporter